MCDFCWKSTLRDNVQSSMSQEKNDVGNDPNLSEQYLVLCLLFPRYKIIVQSDFLSSTDRRTEISIYGSTMQSAQVGSKKIVKFS